MNTFPYAAFAMDFIIAMSEKLAGTGASQGGLLLNTLGRAFSPRNIKEQGPWVAISEENTHGVKASHGG